ncbi:MAG: MerR family transcriptional regulator [Microbacterium sp.]
MWGIGEFAGLTGLSVKALRHYDEKGVLSPAEVDERSGYRQYSEAQLRDGVIVRALRDAGVPLPEVASALRSGDAIETLAAHRRHVLDERERQDRAQADAEAALRALRVPVGVASRVSEPTPYVGRVISVPIEAADELTDDHANDVIMALFHEVREAGLGPSGQFWTALRAGDRGQLDVVCCWPTLREPDAGWGGPGVESGILPARTELVATWRPGSDDALPDGYTHPAVVALFEAVAEHDVDLREAEVRQTVSGTDAGDWTVEVSITAGGR